MATAQTLVTLDEYLRTSYKPDCDFVDGELVERNVGEYSHSKMQLRIGAWFLQHDTEWQIDPLTEQRIQVAPGRVRICDVCVLRQDAPREDVTSTPPLLCIELLSPEDRLSRARLVLEDYQAMGIEHAWLIDPIRRCAYRLGECGLEFIDAARMEVAGTPVYLPLDELFAALDR